MVSELAIILSERRQEKIRVRLNQSEKVGFHREEV